MSRRVAWRRLRLGLPTLLGLRPRGFFIPYRYAGDLPPRDPRDAYPEVGALLRRREDAFASVLRDIDRHAAALQTLRGVPPGAPRWDQDWFPRLDGAAAYAIVRARRPRRIVEIGSGHSTLVAMKALERNRSEDPGAACELTCIEPYPRPFLVESGATVVQQKVEETDPGRFAELGAGDVLFIDSTHMIRPQGDVLFEFLEVLPRLRPGVLVHVHDIFTPRDYPEDWVVRRVRFWNEQYLLEAFLSCNPAFEVVAAANWLAHHHLEALAEKLPGLRAHPSNEPGSFWMRRTGPGSR